MKKRTPSNDKTQIGTPEKAGDRIPERYQASLVIVEGGTGHGAHAHPVILRDRPDKDADVMLKDPLVSRQHAVIVYHDGSYVLKTWTARTERTWRAQASSRPTSATAIRSSRRHGAPVRARGHPRSKTYEIK